MLETCLRYVVHMHEIWLRCALNMEICLTVAWDMYKICQRHASDMCRICLRCIWDMPEIDLRYAWDMFKICPTYSWDIPGICLRYALAMPEIYLEYIWDIMVCLGYWAKMWISEWLSEKVTSREAAIASKICKEEHSIVSRKYSDLAWVGSVNKGL